MDQALENWWQYKTKNALAEAEARTVRILSDLVDAGSISVATAAEKAEMTEQGFLEAAEAIKKKESGVKYGIAKGKFTVPDDIDENNDEIAEMFGVQE